MLEVQIAPEARATPADLVTGTRFVLALVVVASTLAEAPRWLVGAVAALALVTDFVDGRVARARGVTRHGARLDQEADAFLVLVLSAIVAVDLGLWVLGIGLAHYLFGLFFALVPSLRTTPAPRQWCKVVAAVVGITLVGVLALPLPRTLAIAAVGVVAVLLAESFLHEAVDRWRAPRAPLQVGFGSAAAFLAVWLTLVAATDQKHLHGQTLLHLPPEILLVVLLALLPWRRARRGLSFIAGALLGVLLVVTVLDLTFEAVFDRPLDPLGDWTYLGSAVGVLGDSVGAGWAEVAAVLVVVLTAVLVVGLALAMARVVRQAASHRRTTLAAGAAFLLVWLLCLATGVSTSAGGPVAASGAVSLSVGEVRLVHADLLDRSRFAGQIAADPYAGRAATAPASMLSGLAGKDVLIVFVESYGRVAVQDTSYSRGIGRVLDAGTRSLRRAGYHSKSAFLTSPTFGAGSWLAHSTLESGLWVNSQRRYGQLLHARRMTLTSLFGAAGWRTVFDVPADTKAWPEGRRFYGFQHYYDAHDVGYRGPKFGYAPIPDQYTLAAFRRLELASTGRKPVMAEIDLVSSHHPWTPLPHLVPWPALGDGSVFDGMPAQGPSSAEVLKDSAAVKRMYGRSIEYTWQSLISFLTTYDDPNLVVIAVGDHQPHTYVSGQHPGHDVPISVIAQDSKVLGRISGWGWQDGLHPTPDATVWRMDTFRDRFLAAFGGVPDAQPSD